MKEESVFYQKFSLCPMVTPPLKVDPHLLSDGDNEIYPLSPGKNTLLSLTLWSLRHSHLGSEKKTLPCPFHSEESSSPMEKHDRKETLKVQKKNYRQEKKRAAKELFRALKDPSVVIMSDWLKIRGTLKSWTKLWCVLKPGVLLIYKSPKVDHWVGTILLSTCKLIERPSKKDGFCFKLYHPLDQSIWAVKGPKGENVGSITQPLPSSHLIFRAVSELDGRCWMDALELALSCSSLYKLTSKAGRDGEQSSSSSPCPPSAEQLSSAQPVSSLPTDRYSDKSEVEVHEESDNVANENGHRLSEESDMDQSDDLSPALKATSYVEQSQEEIVEAGEAAQTEAVSEENKGLMWTLLKQLRPGMDLSKVVLPTFILEPRSFLDKLSDNYYHANLLSEAVKEKDAYSRLKKILRWYMSGFYKKPKGLKKPYNPVLGETFRCCWHHPETNSCTFYIAEQVSHHPPISAFYVCNKKDGFCINGSILAKSKFYGNSLSAILDGKAKLVFLTRDEEYVITMPYANCKGILYGTMTLELGGKIAISCVKTKCVAELEFKLKPFLGTMGQVNQISGKICHGEEVLATVDGHWDREVYLTECISGQREVLWNPSPEMRKQRLKRRVVQLEQQGQFESERLWRHVTSAILRQDQNRATQEKFLLEEAQRKEARERGGRLWCPRLFTLDSITNEWVYKYTEYLAEGCSTLKIAKLLKRDHQTIKRFIQNSQQGHVEKPRCKITAHELRKVKRAAAKMPLATSLAIFQSCNITGVPKSTRCAILSDMAKVRKAERRPPLKKTHKLKRQDWAKKYLKTDFSKVLWTDEMRVSIDGPDGWARGWIGKGQRAPVRLRRQQGGGGVLVWAGIIKDDLVGPFRVEDGVKLNSQTYCQFLEDTFFKQWYRKKSASFKKNMVFMQDNAPSHASKYSTAWLARKGIKEEKLMTWPPCSPDLNPIDNLWSIIKCEIYKEGKQYTSLNIVWEAVVAAARNVDGEQIKTLTESMDGRLLSVLAKKGGYIGR
uniref:Oxysterol-binding protein n=1 Tax=Denticeps clupeoides TaxID=299321 RepID=A0AAY4C701_9TELE